MVPQNPWRNPLVSVSSFIFPIQKHAIEAKSTALHGVPELPHTEEGTKGIPSAAIHCREISQASALPRRQLNIGKIAHL
jgi:hypothetical protein